MVDSPPTLLDVALAARAAGLSIVPAREDGSKRPLGTWRRYEHALPSEAEIRAWYTNGRQGIGIVCGAVSGNLELLDFDHGGAEVWKQFVRRCHEQGIGDVLDRVVAGYAEKTPRGEGVHALYRCTGPVEGNLKLARRPATPVELAEDPEDKVKVIFETRGEGGYVVTAPSGGPVHPSGRPWLLVRGGFDQIATITPDERQALLDVARSFDELGVDEQPPEPTRSAPTQRPTSGESWMDETVASFNQATTWAEILVPQGWTEMRAQGGVRYWCRPGKDPRLGHSATTNATGSDRFILWSSSVSIPGVEVATGAQSPSYDRFGVWAGYHHGGDRIEAAKAARHAGHGPEWRQGGEGIVLEDLIAPGGGATPPAVSTLPEAPELHLPAELWTARPTFAHILQAARSRLVSPDAVLGAVLARVAACTPHTVELPAIIGSPVGLTFFAGIVGPPEAGKSAAAAVAAELLPAPEAVLDRLPVGTGEGMVEVLFEYVEEEDSKGKKTKVKRQVHYAAIFHIDEGAVLNDLGNRNGATILPTLRTAFSHGTLGNTNASIERRRILDGRCYAYGVTLGIQPELAGPLLGGAAAGTPQRFVWLMATDPQASTVRPEWPGQIAWKPPSPAVLEPLVVARGGWRRFQIAVADEIQAEVVADRVAAMRGEEERDPGDAHRTLVRLKVAALLALLDGRVDLEAEDWELAELIVDTSKRIRLAVEATLVGVEHRREHSMSARAARRELFVEETKDARALASAAKSVARIVVRHAVSKEHEDQGGGCVVTCCRHAMAGKHKAVLAVEEAIDAAASKGWLNEHDGRIWPGESRPA